MPRPTGKPILGAALGAALAMATVLILQQGGVVPPTRLVLFGALALGLSAGSLLLTVTFRRAVPIALQSVAVLLAGFALTGIPAMNDHGSLSDGCGAVATSSVPDTAAPADTSVGAPLEIDPKGTLAYRVTTPVPFENWYYSASMDVGGFPVVIWSGSLPLETFGPVFEGTMDVGDNLTTVEDVTGLSVTGVYHLSGWIGGDGGRCDVDFYVRIPPPTIFSGVILGALWVAVAFILLIAAVYGVQMARLRRSPDGETTDGETTD